MGLYTCENLGIDIETAQWICRMEHTNPSGMKTGVFPAEDLENGGLKTKKVPVCRIFNVLGARWLESSVSKCNGASVVSTHLIQNNESDDSY